MKQTEILTHATHVINHAIHATHVNGWEPAVYMSYMNCMINYMSCMSQNFRLFHVSNLSVRNFRIFLLMYTGSLAPSCRASATGRRVYPRVRVRVRGSGRGQPPVWHLVGEVPTPVHSGYCWPAVTNRWINQSAVRVRREQERRTNQCGEMLPV